MDALRQSVGTIVAVGLTLAIAIPTDLLLYAGVCMGLNWFVFLVQAMPQRTEKYFDLTGSLTFFLVTCLAAILDIVHTSADNWTFLWRSLTVSALVVVWSIRLGSFLFLRIKAAGADDRFDGIRELPWKFLSVWTFQGLWNFMTLLPVILLHVKGASNAAVTSTDIIGLTLWVVGFTCEVVADAQKTAFRKKNQSGINRGRFISTGLWKFSRHPNYFGEILLWIGITVVAVPTLIRPYWGYAVVACFSPLLVIVLLCWVSGIPMLEAKSDAKWGHEPEYQAYKKGTSVLIPWFSTVKIVETPNNYNSITTDPS
jgi:steroid 5-alpha reductase family enzyme